MENRVTTRSCCFQWDIFNPFVPWRNLESTFYHEFPIVTQWKAIIRPLDRRINFWKFSVALEFDEWFDRRHEIVAERLIIIVRLNDAFITRREVPNYCFCRENRYTFDFNEIAYVHPQMKPHHFYIQIEIFLSGRVPRSEVGNGIFTADDLIWLSRDLRKLLKESSYSDLKLMPKNGLEPIQVHSYIIDARWDNFFCLHPFNANTPVQTNHPFNANTPVQTNISRALLMDILNYMYSGEVGLNSPDGEISAYFTELFQVIDRYKLYHFYKVFVNSHSQQIRATRNFGFIESRLFPLANSQGRPRSNASYTWHVCSTPGYAFIFKIRIWKDNLCRPWLSYSLRSRSPSRVYVQVSLEVTKKVEGNNLRRVGSLDERNYTVDPYETVGARCVLFLGCSETFDGFNSSSSNGLEIKHFIRSFLNVMNGETVTQVRVALGGTLQNDLERFILLSDHMHKMRTLKVNADLKIRSRSRGQGPDEDTYEEYIHRGIFESRVQNYSEGLEDVPQPSDLPQMATSTLSNQTLPILLDYVYTGKVFAIPFPFLFEIEEFASDTLFLPLLNLVNRIH